MMATAAATAELYLNGGSDRDGEVLERAQPAAAVAERQTTGASMMEQLVPEITTHALTYLDFPSLCRLSMTNSLMRRAANDDNAWKALYHKVVTSSFVVKSELDRFFFFLISCIDAVACANGTMLKMGREKSSIEINLRWNLRCECRNEGRTFFW